MSLPLKSCMSSQRKKLILLIGKRRGPSEGNICSCFSKFYIINISFLLYEFHVLHVCGARKTFCCGGQDFLRLKHLIHVQKNTFFICSQQLNRYSELSI